MLAVIKSPGLWRTGMTGAEGVRIDEALMRLRGQVPEHLALELLSAAERGALLGIQDRKELEQWQNATPAQ